MEALFDVISTSSPNASQQKEQGVFSSPSYHQTCLTVQGSHMQGNSTVWVSMFLLSTLRRFVVESRLSDGFAAGWCFWLKEKKQLLNVEWSFITNKCFAYLSHKAPSQNIFAMPFNMEIWKRPHFFVVLEFNKIPTAASPTSLPISYLLGPRFVPPPNDLSELPSVMALYHEHLPTPAISTRNVCWEIVFSSGFWASNLRGGKKNRRFPLKDC